jgi:hypothetical protein
MVPKRHKNLNQFLKSIRDEHEAYKKDISESGGWNLHVRSTVAQCLWLYLLHSLLTALIPLAKTWILRGGVAALMVVVYQLWKIFLSEHQPPLVDKIIKGSYFHEMSEGLLHLSLWALGVMTLFTTFGMTHLLNFLKPYEPTDSN